MPSKKKTEPGDGAEHANGRSPSLATPSLPPPQAQAAAKKPAGAKVAPPPPPSQPVLVISRNKHWRYISSFHGPWLQLPPEILETIANANYNTPRPRPIDPAVFFDLVKIRRLVDDATNLAVRAASGVASIAQRGFPGASPHVAALGFGFGHRPPPEAKLSPERKFRMREQATQKLMRAYRLDEIACSVATMQSASSLEEVASLVLQRNPSDPDARYVHFFHEKIPSRQLAECTSLAPLNEIIAGKPSDPEPLRTRATVRVFKGDYQGAVDDLTLALKLHRLYRPSHVALKRPQQEDKTPQPGTTRKQDDVILKEEDQPGSLEMQLLFQRAGIYLAVACDHVAAALSDSPMARDSVAANGNPDHGHQDGPVAEEQPKPELSPAEKEAQRRRADARKLVRHNAKRALRDYTAYLSHFEYSPDLPIEIAEDFTRRVNLAMNGSRAPRSHSYASGPRSPVACEGEGTSASHRIYALSDLFTSSPPSGLPPYPSTDVVLASRAPPSPPGGHVQTTTETVTCHPLLTDALHALLLCHCLIQTSAKELRRHAYMVARLARLADGYPVFQSSRCPARGDWIEVLRAGNNWIQLAGSWEDLCAPAPLPLFLSTGNGATPVPVSHPASKQHKALTAPGSESAPTSSDDLTASSTVATETEQQRKDRINHQAVLDALGDDRVNDETSLRLAIRARQLRAEHDYRINNAAAALEAKFEAKFARGAASSGKKTPANDQPAPTTAAATTATPGPRRPAAAPSAWAWDDVRDYPIASDRAAAIARWVLEAPPPSAGGGGGGGDGDGDAPRRRRKKPAQKTAAAGAAGAAAAAAGGGAGSGVGSGGLVTLAVGSGEVATGGRGDDEGLEEGEASV
ncbi:uncharacterized protein THITE_2144602 [Thermothielavioides terrestris NRRL 8126]|uniref:Uncharacterized protein n=1 Tax=Thermothielavioides terrestris (strain ATCC 38088 / NRRL 8126) TaxID=578455 RepID=G2QZE4_THETT|nr:uncharacterized protein THITE_2144602 [Thermothielavioides terrestris NRRL 8126]AEO67177.1 hypothetical protein THITE_2144602 [Thermothielavioides terrestris NRRL 8126]